MKKGKVVAMIAMVVISVAIVSTAIGMTIFTVLKNRRNAQFHYELTKIDTLLTKGNLIDASAQMNLLDEPPKGYQIGMSYLKRAFLISDGLKDYSLLLKTAKKIYEINDPVQEITAIYVYALLRKKEFNRAYKLAKNLKESRYSSLLAESYLQAVSQKHNKKEEDSILSEEDRHLLDLKDFDAEQVESLIPIYEGAMLYSSDLRLIKNLVLLYCAKGEYKKAWLLASQRLKSSALQLYIQVGYDAGHFDEVLSAIEMLESPSSSHASLNLSELLLIKADLYLHLQRPKEALLLYKKFIEDNPDFSVVPYRNFAFLAQFVNPEKRSEFGIDDEGLRRIYEKILDFKEPYSDLYTSDVELILTYVELLNRMGKKDSAIAFLNRYVQFPAVEANTQMHLMLHRLVDAAKIDYYISQLDYLMNKDPDNELIPKSLAYYLIAFPDRKPQLDRVLTLSKDRFHHREWIDHYSAWAALLDPSLKSYQEAGSLYSDLYRRYKRWEYAKNASEIYSFISDLPEAMRMANEAENRLLAVKPSSSLTTKEGNRNLKEKFALVKVLQARISEKMGKFEEAREDYRAALSYDPANIDAILALQRLIQEK